MAYSYDRTAARPIQIDKVQARRLANKARRMLPGQLRFRADDMEGPLKYARGFNPNKWFYHVGVASMTDVRGQQVEVPFQVQSKSDPTWGPRRWIAGGGVATRKFHDSPIRSKLSLYVTINTERSPKDLIEHLDEVEDEIFSVLAHEFTHLRDLLTEDAPDAGQDLEAYYNRPTEVRAFMQQVVDEVLRRLHKLGDQPGGGWIFAGPGPSSQFIEDRLYESLTWDRVHRYLTPATEHLMLKSVARAIQDEWPELQKRYPDDPIPDD